MEILVVARTKGEARAGVRARGLRWQDVRWLPTPEAVVEVDPAAVAELLVIDGWRDHRDGPRLIVAVEDLLVEVAVRRSAKDHPAPGGLGLGGRTLWRRVVAVYELRPDELELLESACRERDLLDRLEAELAGVSTTTAGSMGQEVAHPVLSELRQHRSTYRQLLGALKLPDEAGETSRSSAAREAAAARWSA